MMRRRGRLQRPGLSMIEMLINLVIVATLMLAVTVALRAMLGQFRGNDAALRARRTATVSLEYMLSAIRQAKIVDLGSTPTSENEVTSSSLRVVDYFDRADATKTTWRTFTYDSQTKTLKLSRTGGTAQVVLSNVSRLSFRAKPELDTVANVVTWRSVTIDLQVEAVDMAGKRIPMNFSGTSFARSVPLN